MISEETKNQNEKIDVLYIAGGGHSGSTILSLVIGSAPDVFATGELKFYNQHKDPDFHLWNYIQNICTCGKDANNCPFWVRVEQHLSDGIDIFHYMKPKDQIITLIKILWPFYKVKQSDLAQDDYHLIRAVKREALMDKPSTRYILDTSKSVARLMHLKSHPKLNVRIIFLVRDGRGYVNSYLRSRQESFYRSIFQWIVNNFLTLAYLRKEKIDYYYLSYDLLCTQPDKYLAEINDKFSINIPEDYIRVIPEMDFHLRAANPSRSTLREFRGLVADNKWRVEMPISKRLISSVILSPFNYWWVYGRSR